MLKLSRGFIGVLRFGKNYHQRCIGHIKHKTSPIQYDLLYINPSSARLRVKASLLIYICDEIKGCPGWLTSTSLVHPLPVLCAACSPAKGLWKRRVRRLKTLSTDLVK